MLLLLAALAPAGVTSAAANDTVDCISMADGQVDITPASGSNARRAVQMNEGDTLAFSFQADKRATGTVTLVAGDGRQQRLPYGPHASELSYTAEQSGAVSIHLAAKSGKSAIFIMTCKPARGWDAIARDAANANASLPLPPDATAAMDGTATTPAPTGTAPLQWLGGVQPGQEPVAGTYGVNLALQPNFVVGVLAQFDQATDPLLGPSPLSDQPWQMGPTTSLKLGNGLSLDAHAAWGSADPIVGHSADRQTLDARLTSSQEAGAWRFSPSIGFSHTYERLAIVDQQLAEIAGYQTVESGRVEIKPELSYRFDTGHSTYIEPRLMVGTFWSLDAATADAAAGALHEPRQFAETGVTFGAADGATLQVGGAVEEGQTPAENVWSGRLQLNIPLK